jgi:hypothetical protein
VQLTQELDTADDELVTALAATPVVDGRIVIRSNGVRAHHRVAWQGWATRADVAPFDIEPFRSDVNVHGEGPY